MNQSNSRGLSNNFDLEKEVNKLRDENRLIKEEYQRRMNDNNMNSNNREKVPEGNINYIKNKGEYLNLIKNDNNRRNNEEEKMERGPSGNYNNKDQEYDRFVNNQKIYLRLTLIIIILIEIQMMEIIIIYLMEETTIIIGQI